MGLIHGRICTFYLFSTCSKLSGQNIKEKKWRLWLPQGYKIIWLYHGTESMYRWWKGFVGVPWRKSLATRINQFVSVFGETNKVYNQMRKKIIGCLLVMSWKSGICPLPLLNLFTLSGGVLPSSHRRCGPWCRTKFEKIFHSRVRKIQETVQQFTSKQKPKTPMSFFIYFIYI